LQAHLKATQAMLKPKLLKELANTDVLTFNLLIKSSSAPGLLTKH